jgi:hypothetical protein
MSSSKVIVNSVSEVPKVPKATKEPKEPKAQKKVYKSKKNIIVDPPFSGVVTNLENTTQKVPETLVQPIKQTPEISQPTPETTNSISFNKEEFDEEEDYLSKLDTVVKSVLEKYIDRSMFGKKKYGTTLDRKDLTILDWINHTQEELMDATLYLEKLKKTLIEHSIRNSTNTTNTSS